MIPRRLSPMLLTQRREPFDGDRWLFEPKWDGWRCLAVVRDGRARLLSRNGNDLTARFPGVADGLEHLPDGTVVDGEIVMLDADGYPNFDALMRRQGSPCLLAFDLLAVGGCNICDEPLEDRKSCLVELVSGVTSQSIQNTESIVGDGKALFDLVAGRGMEGIVAKRLGSVYAPGRRSGAWIKIKVLGYAPERWADWFDGGGRRYDQAAE